MVARLVVLPETKPHEAYSAHVAKLSQTRSTLVVACRRPMALLKGEFAAAGARMDHLFILDVTPGDLQPRVSDPEHEAVVTNPALLELIAAKIDKIVRAKAERQATIVVDDLTAFSLFVPADALQEIIRYAIQNLTRPNDDREYICAASFTKTPLFEALQGIVDEVVALHADGTARPHSAPAPTAQ